MLSPYERETGNTMVGIVRYEERALDSPERAGPPPREVLKERVEGDFLVEDDPRTTDALKGYVLQAVNTVETGEGFCEDERCRLSNPHRQPGVVEAQLRDPGFCEEHAQRYAVEDG